MVPIGLFVRVLHDLGVAGRRGGGGLGDGLGRRGGLRGRRRGRRGGGRRGRCHGLGQRDARRRVVGLGVLGLLDPVVLTFGAALDGREEDGVARGADDPHVGHEGAGAGGGDRPAAPGQRVGGDRGGEPGGVLGLHVGGAGRELDLERRGRRLGAPVLERERHRRDPRRRGVALRFDVGEGRDGQRDQRTDGDDGGDQELRSPARADGGRSAVVGRLALVGLVRCMQDSSFGARHHVAAGLGWCYRTFTEKAVRCWSNSLRRVMTVIVQTPGMVRSFVSSR